VNLRFFAVISVDASDHQVASISGHGFRRPGGRADSVFFNDVDAAFELVGFSAAKPASQITSAPSTNFILADVHVSNLHVSPEEMAIFWHQYGVVVFFPIASGRYRVIADIGSAARHDPTFAEIQALVSHRAPAGVTLSDPVWLAGFGVNERKVKDYRAGRLFLVGDAAHIHSPAGGQGMNTGMHDAFNLSWKLALVEHGSADPGLLDSYSAERSAVAAQILSDSGRMTSAATLRNPLA
jgi:2-polyprenyl-6-methoxyphenol hydroxylase-like FAD-dependent oxidoreductase